MILFAFPPLEYELLQVALKAILLFSSKCSKGVMSCKSIIDCKPDGGCPGNQVWSPRSESTMCLKTCENLHLPCLYSTGTGGCHCANDTVWDSSINKCVLATQCPCKLNGRSYTSGQVVKRDCNRW